MSRYPADFLRPTVIGSSYVCDSNNHRIQKFTGSGTYLTQWGSFGPGNGQFNSPYGIAVNAAFEIFVADFDNYRVQKFGQVSTPVKTTTWGRIKGSYR